MSRKGLLPQVDTDHKSDVKLDSGPIQSIRYGLLPFAVDMYGQLLEHPEKLITDLFLEIDACYPMRWLFSIIFYFHT